MDNNTEFSPKSFAVINSVDWANQTLRNAIEFLQEGANSENHWLWNQRLAVTLVYKKELLEAGFTWQAERIDNWIHRLQPIRADLLRERGAH